MGVANDSIPVVLVHLGGQILTGELDGHLSVIIQVKYLVSLESHTL